MITTDYDSPAYTTVTSVSVSSSSPFESSYSNNPASATYHVNQAITSNSTFYATSSGSIEEANNVPSSSATAGPHEAPLSTTQKGIISAGVGIVIILGILLCVFCRRRRRSRNGYMENRNMEQLPTTSNVSLTDRPDPFEIIPLPPPSIAPPLRYSQVVPPTPRQYGASTPIMAPERRYRAVSTTASSWADDSELDAFATDGSSLARTLSTNSQGTIVSENTITGENENPFDHPAYTLPSNRHRQRTNFTGTLSSEGNHRSVTVQRAIDPFADSSSVSPISPISPITPISSASVGVARARALDDIFASVHEGPEGTETETTFIHHIDAGRAPSQRALGVPEPDRIGDGEVHIPPTYMELYPTPRR